ncbi:MULTISPECIES: SMC-Scp complex subunit ScpB [unclassified Luteococcus]|uniref:SMC-Scp complex subunit ScpB n=1 Tax=unclassified Luteococcus TaxID=2639923 RepID=UPI00313E2488
MSDPQPEPVVGPAEGTAGSGPAGTGADLPDRELTAASLEERAEEAEGPLEALLLMAEEPVPAETLAEAIGQPLPVTERALANLVEFYDRSQRGFELRNVGGGWRYWTRAEHAELISRWVVSGQSNKLSQAALETLSVIAYLQPISRARVSAVRGVNVDGVVRTLLARGLISEAGADEQTGAMVFSTTDYFLERMGLASLDELPPLAPHLPDASALEEELSQLAATVEVDTASDDAPPVLPEADEPVAVDEQEMDNHD